MTKDKKPYVCPAEFAYSLDNVFRKLVHNPRKILKPYIIEGMTVLDLGCGPGYFTTELARLVGNSGKVIAADLQQKMLDMMTKKIAVNGFEHRVKPHLCSADRIGISIKVDFVLAFWMVHEVPDQESLFSELKSLLNPEGKILIAEPKFHVNSLLFNQMITRLESRGLSVIENPKVTFSRSVLVS